MDNNTFQTEFVSNELAKCEDIDELKEKIFPMLKSQQDAWQIKINDIIESSGYTKSRFAELCGVSRVTINKWCNGAIPKNRETFLKIGMAAGFNREKMDQLLTRYGQYPELYAKTLEDAVAIYVLENENQENLLEKYTYILEKIKGMIIDDSADDAEDVETKYFDEKLSNVKNETELEEFITENASVFAMAYNRFYAVVLADIEANYIGANEKTVFEMAEGQGWSSSLKQCVSAMRQKKWYPTRNKVISLGLHLSMDHEQIDEILEQAHMRPLYAKNIFESVIIFILEDASLNDMLNEDSDEYDPDELCRYAREVLEDLDLPEINSFINELPEMDDDDAW